MKGKYNISEAYLLLILSISIVFTVFRQDKKHFIIFQMFSDINECAIHVDNCDRATTICVNTKGGYRCDPCPHGYEPVKNICTGM